MRKAAKKVIFLVARPLRGGGGGKGVPAKKKKIFFETFETEKKRSDGH